MAKLYLGGAEPSNIFLEGNAISGAWLGGNKVWPTGGDTPYYWQEMNSPASLPQTGFPKCSACPTSNVLATATTGNPAASATFLYSYSGLTLTKLSNPTNAPNYALGNSFTHDGTMWVSGAGNTLLAFLFNAETNVFTYSSSLTVADWSDSIRFSDDDKYMAVTCSGTAPFLRLYKKSGTTFTALSIPSGILPTVGLYDIAWRRGTYEFAVASHTAGKFYRFVVNSADDSISILPDITLPATAASGGIAYIGGRHLITSTSTDIFVLEISDEGSLTIVQNFNFTGGARCIAPTNAGTEVAIGLAASGTGPMVSMYKWTGSGLEPQDASVTANIPEGQNAYISFSSDDSYMFVTGLTLLSPKRLVGFRKVLL